MSAARAPLAMIWAQSTTGVIGGEGDIPWHIPGEQRRFKELTLGGTVIMGRKTWESLPERVRPLTGRDNVVLTRAAEFTAPGARIAHSLDEALDVADPSRQAWCIGGSQLYAQLIGVASRLEVTEVDVDVAGDAYAPPIDESWRAETADAGTDWHTSPAGVRYRFTRYLR